MLPYRNDLKLLARQLRSDMTPAERALSKKLRRKQILGIQFYRQKPILDFIVDFYAPEVGLVVEIDGGQHSEKDHLERDEIRDETLSQVDLTVLRFSNHQVLNQGDEVLERIRRTVAERL